MIHLMQDVKKNLKVARFGLNEISGAFGDMGTFLPLLVGMVENNALPFVSSLFFAGLFNLLTGLVYPIPMAVQPMKAIAATALTEGLNPDEIVSAGLITGLFVLVLGLTGGIHWVNKVIPKSVVRGLQLGIGLALAQKGLFWAFGVTLTSPMGILVMLSIFLVVLNLRFSLPSAMLIFLGGILWEGFHHPALLHGISFRLSFPSLAFPSLQSFPRGLSVAVSQIPLTTLNSVISVVVLSRDLFPSLFSRPPEEVPVKGRFLDPRDPVTTPKVAVTVGIMNLLGSLFGAMPVCHGSGGLAGQYRFGARTNGSIIFLGLLKMLVALLFGFPLLLLIQAYPEPLLGILLLVAGLELASSARKVTGRIDFFFLLLTAVGILVKGTLFGVLLGTLAYWISRGLKRWR